MADIRSRNVYSRRAVLTAAAATIPAFAQSKNANLAGGSNLELGTFSVSLTVKDLKASREFYEKLGFKVFAGQPSGGYLIMRNGEATLGLFQGMFEKNMLTFNPGWDSSSQKKSSFTDVRD